MKLSKLISYGLLLSSFALPSLVGFAQKEDLNFIRWAQNKIKASDKEAEKMIKERKANKAAKKAHNSVSQ